MTGARRDHPLTRDELLDAALAIVDSKGLGALTMRRLADAVGVEAMSLYHHVPSKDALLDGTVERMRSEMRLPASLPDDWAAILEAIFVEYRRLLTAHPNMMPLATRRTDNVATSGLEFLIGRGIAPDDAVELYQSLVAFTIGYSTAGSSLVPHDWAGLPPELAERTRDWREETFRRSLRAIMDGYTSAKAPGPARDPAADGHRASTGRVGRKKSKSKKGESKR
jgi:TetR/AcrR family tetracycline transcriptional repressor